MTDTQIFSPTLTGAFFVSFGRFARTQVPQAPGLKSLQDLGVQVPLGTSIPIFPGVRANISGFVNVFSGGALRQYPTSFVWKATGTKMAGAHTLNFGLEFERTRVDVNDYSYVPGDNTFNGQVTGNAVSDFFLGYPSQFFQDNGRTLDLRESRPSLFFQDDWKVRRQFTVNLGVRCGWRRSTSATQPTDLYLSIPNPPSFTNPYQGFPGGNPFPRAHIQPSQFASYKFILPVSGGMLDPSSKVGYTENWNLTLERQLRSNMVLTVAYVGNHGVNIMGSRQLNPALYYPGATVAQENNHRLFPGMGAVEYASSYEYTHYHVQEGDLVTIPMLNYHPVFSQESPLEFIWCIAGERYWVGDKNKSFMSGSGTALTTELDGAGSAVGPTSGIATSLLHLFQLRSSGFPLFFLQEEVGQLPAHRGDVLAHGALGFRPIVAFECRHDGFVESGSRTARKVIRFAAADPNLILHVVQDLTKAGVTGRVRQIRVKADVLGNIVRLFVVGQKLAHPLQTPRQPCKQFGSQFGSVNHVRL